MKISEKQLQMLMSYAGMCLMKGINLTDEGKDNLSKLYDQIINHQSTIRRVKRNRVIVNIIKKA